MTDSVKRGILAMNVHVNADSAETVNGADGTPNLNHRIFAMEGVTLTPLHLVGSLIKMIDDAEMEQQEKDEAAALVRVVAEKIRDINSEWREIYKLALMEERQRDAA